ncbi:MAG: hypothetical protein QF842_02410 [Candidatus Marinimicrobia bacterium]|jgi:hypothetical protein|nr:hypothetical protein [Candidatus Neomarinimicrobiota bacterium]MDP6611486.1 hypothetical protein [Candidatus Neomarinimicrobiota bacterium]|tara:strand:- start:8968 stop:9609 length:642 start_codon:yes stop_codon:yes gene_type:complete
MKILIKPIAIILINTILLAQVKIVSTSGKPTKVAYAGIKIENMESWAEAELQNKFKSIFNGLNPSQVIFSEEVTKIAKAQVDSLFLDMTDIKSFQNLAEKTGTKYVFVGKFKNVSPDESRIMVQGDFYRYNAELKSSFRYEVLKYYERINDETVVIKKQLVDSIPNAAKPASAKQLLIVFGVILLVGLLFMSLTGTDVWAEGDGHGGPQPTEN